MDLEKFKGNPLRTRKPEEYNIGTLYYIQCEINHDEFLITKCEGKHDEHRIRGRCIGNFGNSTDFVFGEVSTTPYVTGRPSRIATVDEVIWYTACVNANKYVSKEDALLKPKPKRVIPTEKSYIITESQLQLLYHNSPIFIKSKLEEWYDFDLFYEKVEG